MTDGPLELDTRRRLYAYLKGAPGAHFSQIQRDLALATGTLQYHLRYLETRGLVDARTDGKYTRYYTSLDIDRRWKPALGLLRQPTPRQVVVDLLEHGPSALNAISERTGVAVSTLSFHLKKLMDAEVVVRPERGRYALSDPDAMLGLLAEYRAGFLDAAVDRVVRLFTGIQRPPAPREEAAEPADRSMDAPE